MSHELLSRRRSQPEGCRPPEAEGITATSAHEEGTEEWPDEDHLEKAGREGARFVTRNRDDFIEWTVRFFQDQRPHAGVLIAPYTYSGDQFSLLAEVLADYAHQHPEGMSPYAIDFLPPPAGPRLKRRRKKKP